MKSSKDTYQIISQILVTILIQFSHGYKDITVEYEFGCTWLGGSLVGTLKCSCFQDAKEMYLRKGDIPSFDTYAIHIDNCNSVRFGNEVISTSRNLRKIELVNIKKLTFEESSLFWDGYTENVNPYSYNNQGPDYSDRTMPGLTISIVNSVIQDIGQYSFKGRINEINFENVTFEKISPFAFTSLIQNVQIGFSNCNFKSIQPQAFKKFSTNNLVFSNCVFDDLPSRTFSEIEVFQVFLIKACKFSRVFPSAFLVKGPNHFDILDSKFDILDGDALKVSVRGEVSIKDSIFNATNGGAFLGIRLNKEKVHQLSYKFYFVNDTFNNLFGDTLAVDRNSFEAEYDKILLNQQCDCWYIDRILEDNRFYEEIKCLQEDLQHITMKEFKLNNCSVFSKLSVIIIVVVVVLILLVIIVSGIVIYIKRVFKGTKQKEYLSDKNGKPLSLIMPDGRTYKETELHVIVERADLLTTDL